MINSVSATSSVSQIYLPKQQQDVTHMTKALPKPGKQHSVVLSKEAQAAAQAARQSQHH